MNLDKPVVVQYGAWMINIISRGDPLYALSTEWRHYYNNNRFIRYTVFQHVGDYIIRTVEILTAATSIAVVLTAFLAAVSLIGWRRVLEYAAHYVVKYGSVIAPLLLTIIWFKVAVQFESTRNFVWLEWKGYWAPSIGLDQLRFSILPSLALSLIITYGFAKSLIPSLKKGMNLYHQTSVADHSSDPRLWKRVSRAVTLRLLRSSKSYLAVLLAALLLTETVFGWPGLSMAAKYSSEYDRLLIDLPVLYSATIVLTLGYVLVWLASDIARAFLDPQFLVYYRIGAPSGAETSSQYVQLNPSIDDQRKSMATPILAIAAIFLIMIISCASLSTILIKDTRSLGYDYHVNHGNKPAVWQEEGSWSNALGTDYYGRDRLGPFDSKCKTLFFDRRHYTCSKLNFRGRGRVYSGTI